MSIIINTIIRPEHNSTLKLVKYKNYCDKELNELEEDENIESIWKMNAIKAYVNDFPAAHLTVRWVDAVRFEKKYPKGIVSFLEKENNESSNNRSKNQSLEYWSKKSSIDLEYELDIQPTNYYQALELALEKRSIEFYLHKIMFLNKPTVYGIGVYDHNDQDHRVFPGINQSEKRTERTNYRGLGISELLYQTMAQWLYQDESLNLYASVSQQPKAIKAWNRLISNQTEQTSFQDILNTNGKNQSRLAINGQSVQLTIPDWINNVLVDNIDNYQEFLKKTNNKTNDQIDEGTNGLKL